MSIKELQDKLRRVTAQITNNLDREILAAGADIAALVEDRVVQTGRDFQGASFSPYSTKEIPAFLYIGRSRNAAGENRIRKAAQKKEMVSYKEFREFNGLRTQKKIFEFTGEMWQGFGVTGVRQERPGVYSVTIGGKNSRTQELIGYHSAREGVEITAPSQQEINIVLRGLQTRIANLIQNA